MKKQVYSRAKSQEEIPILRPLERQHTLLNTAVDPANPEWHELTLKAHKHMESFSSVSSRSKMSTSSNSKSERCLSSKTSSSTESQDTSSSGQTAAAAATMVITDTDLASSWLYKSKKGMYPADGGITNEAFDYDESDLADSPPSVLAPPPPIPDHALDTTVNPAADDCLQQFLFPPKINLPRSNKDRSNDDFDEGFSNIRLKPIPIAKKRQSKTTCCCYMTVLLVAFICMFGLLSAIGGIVYLEVFISERTLGHLVRKLESNSAGIMKSEPKQDDVKQETFHEAGLSLTHQGSGILAKTSMNKNEDPVHIPEHSSDPKLSITQGNDADHEKNRQTTRDFSGQNQDYSRRMGTMLDALHDDSAMIGLTVNDFQRYSEKFEETSFSSQMPDSLAGILEITDNKASIKESSEVDTISLSAVDLKSFLKLMNSNPNFKFDCSMVEERRDLKNILCRVIVPPNSKDPAVNPSPVDETDLVQDVLKTIHTNTPLDPVTDISKVVSQSETELSSPEKPAHTTEHDTDPKIITTAKETSNGSQSSGTPTGQFNNKSGETVSLSVVSGTINSKPSKKTDIEVVSGIAPTPVQRKLFISGSAPTPVMQETETRFEDPSSSKPLTVLNVEPSSQEDEDYNTNKNRTDSDDLRSTDIPREMFLEYSLINSDDNDATDIPVQNSKTTPDPEIPPALRKPVSRPNIPVLEMNKIPPLPVMPIGFDRIIEKLKQSNARRSLPNSPNLLTMPTTRTSVGVLRQITATFIEPDDLTDIFGMQRTKQGNLQDSIIAVLRRLQALEHNTLPSSRASDPLRQMKRPRMDPVGENAIEKKLYLDKLRVILYDNA